MKKRELKELATSVTTTTFIVIALTGIMLFFDWFNTSVEDLHEELGVAFTIAGIVHVYVNWNSMKSYFSKKIFLVAIVITLVISLFYVQEGVREFHPKEYMIETISKAPMKETLNILDVDYNVAKSNLLKSYSKNLDEFKSLDELGVELNDTSYGAFSVLKGMKNY